MAGSITCLHLLTFDCTCIVSITVQSAVTVTDALLVYFAVQLFFKYVLFACTDGRLCDVSQYDYRIEYFIHVFLSLRNNSCIFLYFVSIFAYCFTCHKMKQNAKILQF